jgi:hypothetical protein
VSNGEISRRSLLAASFAPAGVPSSKASASPRLAAIVTEFRKHSHAQNIVDRFIEGYGWEGQHRRPTCRIVSLYVDQRMRNHLSRERAARVPDLRLYPTIEEALTLGTDKLSVDGVLLIGEHGDYPVNQRGQTLYPRYEFFRRIVELFDRSGRAVPVFNDKHLSWKWEWAQEMVRTSRNLGFPLMAGSSLPVTQRIPAVDLPWGAQVREAVTIGPGGVDSYDFHALEAMQSLLERRRGGETGVESIQALRGERVWSAMAANEWDPELVSACLCRSMMLEPGRQGFNHLYPQPEVMRQLVKDPVAYRLRYRDGVRATMLLLDPLVGDITVAVRLKDREEPLSTQMYLGAGHEMQPNFFNPLVRNIERLIEERKSPTPIERTLLTTGLVAAGVESLFRGGEVIATPHLAIRYQGSRRSGFYAS